MDKEQSIPKEKSKSSLESGMYNVTFVNDFGSYKKDDKAIYHSSTAEALERKKIIKIDSKIKIHEPKTMKK
jgi:hypothetical protein